MDINLGTFSYLTLTKPVIPMFLIGNDSSSGHQFKKEYWLKIVFLGLNPNKINLLE